MKMITSPRKTYLIKYLAAVAAILSALPASAVIVNVDFNGARDNEAVGPTYLGSGAAGGGSTFNGVTANSWTGSGNNDNLTVTASNLQSDSGGPTSIGLSFTPVGGDDHPLNGTNALWRDYLFIQSGGNSSNATFTISGLGSATTADLYFYHMFDDGGNSPLTITGIGTSSTFTASGMFTAANTLFFDNVAVSGGEITGLWSSVAPQSGILNGLTIVTVPEPSTVLLMCVGGCVALFCRRRLA